MLFDIHTERAAQQTLFRLTGIPIEVWEENIDRERDYELQDYFVAAMIEEYGTRHLPESYLDLDFIYFHVTTSADSCASIRRNGILDLKKAYECKDSELRRFLDEHGVSIDIEKALLIYRGHEYDIYFGRCPWDHESVEYKCWSIGRKFFYDYTTCGFLSAWDRSPYGGQVHRRPEILKDIDELLMTRLSDEWEQTHTAYEVVAKVSGENICYPYDDDASETEKVMAYVVMAYNEALNGSSENILLLKNGVQIPPSDILEVNPLSIWI